MEQQVYTLEQWRKIRGLSQEELAKKSDVSVRTIWNYESDIKKLRNASYSTIAKIAKVLDIKTAQIFL